MNFITPEASVLIVDDNEINLEVTAGFLEPLQMKIDMADSGKRALQMAQRNRYHLIFMDHMMPVMDGVETTRRLRQMEGGYYSTVPIIALTANALEDVRDEFIKAGMSDYLAKPVEPMEIYKCVLKWLPRKLIVVLAPKPSGNVTAGGNRVKAEEKAGQAGNGRPAARETAGKQDTGGEAGGKTDQGDHILPDLPGINAEDGIKYTGSEKMWLKLLGDFYMLIDSKAGKIEKCLADGMIRDYTIEVHAMKNTARMIGASHLSEWFFKMEKCGKAGDIETITKETPGLIQEFKSFKEILRPYGEENNRVKREVPVREVTARLAVMRDAMERFDLDAVDAAMQQLEQYRIPEKCNELMEVLRVAVVDVNMKLVMDTADKMIGMLGA